MQTEALCLRAADFGESDRIVHLLTPDAGRLAAIAKGAKRSGRRFPGTLDVFNRLRIQVAARRRPGTLARLDQAQLVTWYPGLRMRADRFALGCYLLELLDRLAPEGGARGESARLFAFAERALAVVERSSPDARLRVLLELRALDALGLRPELSRCVRCGGDPAAFHVAEGGPLCRGCGARITSSAWTAWPSPRPRWPRPANCWAASSASTWGSSCAAKRSSTGSWGRGPRRRVPKVRQIGHESGCVSTLIPGLRPVR
jgi:DNA repair protein RecO (recombination protein O)